MIKTILFDLDGTLLPLNMDKFLKRYFKELSIKFRDFFKAEELTKLIWESTEYMINNTDGNKTNAHAFFENFYSKIPYDSEDIDILFNDFYNNDFYKIGDMTSKSQTMVAAVNLLRDKGYELVVATNPLFPKQAILDRIEWAGLDREDFIYISCFEEMHYCKPHIQFYEELLSIIDRRGEECMMVGNDLEEDMVAKKIGISTYLIEDFKIQRENDMSMVDNHGMYRDFYKFIGKLPQL